VKYAFEAIGTWWQIDSTSEKDLLKAITERIDYYDKVFSRFRTDSLITKISKQAGTFVFPPEAEPLFELYRKMYKVTDGLVTPLIGDVLSQAGYDADYSLNIKEMNTPQALDDVVKFNYPKITTTVPLLVDVGAAGKGQLVDLVGELLEQNGVGDYTVDAGGDIRVRGSDEVRVGLEHPDDAKKVIGYAALKNQSICGSAGNRRAWGEFHHIINPKTLTSPKNILSVWVVADTTMLADGLSTCLFFTDPAVLQKHFSFEYVIMYADYSVSYSKGFRGEIF
jgi:thiamine biosynthesis lipoprotein